MAKILVIDHQRASRNNLVEILELEKYNVTACEYATDCKRLILKNKYDLIIYNAHMPDMNGVSFINYVHNKDIDTAIIMTTDKPDLDIIVKCMREGVVDFIEKPFDVNRLLVSVKQILSKVGLKKEFKQLHKKVIETIPEIIGSSSQVMEIKRMIERVSGSDVRVLITGSNGTGKELVARWLHELSPRKAEPLIEVNCAAIPNDLIESELFGHEKGAFTSASDKHIGKFELANGGTLFLDEIGDMSLSAQAKVLRVLQEGKICRVGGTKEISVDVRIFAATNKDLIAEIARSNFREDLYHRLNVIPIHVPKLAERSEDIPLLVNKFILSISKRRGEAPKEITKEAMLLLQNRPWPGNIRELQNNIERLVILCDGVIVPTDIDQYCCY